MRCSPQCFCFISFSIFFSHSIPGEALFPLNRTTNSRNNGLKTVYKISTSNKISRNPLNETTIRLLDAENDKPQNKFRCIKCNTLKDKNCMEINDPIFFSNCISSFGQCYTAIIDGIVHRGCIGDDLFPDQPSIGNPKYETHVCNNDPYCNKEKITDTCIVCTGASSECAKPTLASEKSCSLDGQGVGCYLRKTNNGDYERGCVKHLIDLERNECDRPGSDYCQRCVGRNCNKKSEFYQQCYFCNGANAKTCFDTVDKRMTTTCLSYSNRCLVGVDAEGYAHRQCSSTVEKDLARFPNGYELCDENLCNTQIFPKEWTKCFRCTSENDDGCDHPSATMLPQNCRVLNDECYIYGIEGIDRHIRTKNCIHSINNHFSFYLFGVFFGLWRTDNEFQRGCMGDETEGRFLCEESKDNCYKCNTTQCNYLQSFQLKKLGGSNGSKLDNSAIRTISASLFVYYVEGLWNNVNNAN